MDIVKVLSLLKYMNRDALTAEGLAEIAATLNVPIPPTELPGIADIIRTRGTAEGAIRLVPYWMKRPKPEATEEVVKVRSCPVCGGLVSMN